MSLKRLLCLGFVFTLSKLTACSTTPALVEQKSVTTTHSVFEAEAVNRLMSNHKFHEHILDEMLKNHDLVDGGTFKFVGQQRVYNTSVESCLLTLGTRVLEQPTGRYLAIGAGNGTFEVYARWLFPEFRQWFTVLTDAVDENVSIIKEASEKFTLDANELEKQMSEGVLRGHTFDVISVQNVLQFLSENERIRCLNTLSKLLNPNGIILLSYEQRQISRAPLDLQIPLFKSLDQADPGIYFYYYAHNYTDKSQDSNVEYCGPPHYFRPLGTAFVGKTNLSQRLSSIPNPDDLSVQDAIMVTGDGGFKAKLHRGTYPKEAMVTGDGGFKAKLHRGTYPKEVKNAQVLEFAIVYRAIDFSQFPELEVVTAKDHVRFKSPEDTKISACIQHLDPILFYVQQEFDQQLKPHGVLRVLKKKTPVIK